ncbi:hypothetical protein [Clostridium perfringens]|uniref:hypothetical protein n=1 Tax=Clostridium perfringens TaxID=1502 RepID=UPI001B829A8C|nr:hypothetical protein [Clostridium perfringens]MDH2474282.1 hypothetical protein [Clostridium perfringens]MDK0667368.1 hypothetical protein [Clostridium perfringens]MDT7986952.1 hypothetical protein [Clostridium perfringens]HBC2031019.1 hypothetical protein [Clostridium perfringens]HBC2034368.1 hypothetical protein [Clostridium perfringens]
MDMLEVSKKVSKRVQEQLEVLKLDKPLKCLIEEEIKKECKGTDQSSQSTQEILKTSKF